MVRRRFGKGTSMRPHRIVNYTSVLQLLGEKGCPVCAFLKNYQAALLQEPLKKDVNHLCNFHTWGLAATQNPIIAAELFLTLLSHPAETVATSSCDICLLLHLEEERRIRELISCLEQRLAVSWIRAQGVLCIVHGLKVKSGSSPASAVLVESALKRQRERLTQELTQLLEQYDPNPVKWGTLGRVAEYLAAQRGLQP